MSILYIIGAVIWFLAIRFIGSIFYSVDVNVHNVESFRNYFFLRGLEIFGVFLISLAPLVLIGLRISFGLRRFKYLVAFLVIITTLSAAFFLAVSSTPIAAKAMMKVPLISSAYSVSYKCYIPIIEVDASEDNSIEFNSTQSSESVINFYDQYFTNHGFERTLSRLDESNEVSYTCFGTGIVLTSEGNRTTLNFKGAKLFGKSCLSKL